jgi:hypothetical protein
MSTGGEVPSNQSSERGRKALAIAERVGFVVLYVVSGFAAGVFVERSHESENTQSFVSSISGEVICPPGENVTGIYLRPYGTTGGFIPRESVPGEPNAATFSEGFTAKVGAYTISVGCGGTEQNWAHDDRSSLITISDYPVRVECSDEPNSAGNDGTLVGSCIVEPLVQPSMTPAAKL